MQIDPSASILITGGTGFAGSHLVELLIASGYTNIHVTAYTNENSFVHTLLPANAIHTLDLTHQETTFALLQQLQPKWLFHLAAFASVGDSFEKASHILTNNLQLQLNVLEAVRTQSAKTRVLSIGSAQEYDVLTLMKTHPSFKRISESTPLGPINPYGVSKVDQDLLALSYFYSYKLDIVRARPFNHTGERQVADFAIPNFARQIAAIEKGQNLVLRVGDLSATRDMSDVKDVVAAYVILMQKGQAGEVYNVGSGMGSTMQDMLDLLVKISTSSISVEIDPQLLRPNDIPYMVADTTALTQLGWAASVPLPQTLSRVLNYWRNL